MRGGAIAAVSVLCLAGFAVQAGAVRTQFFRADSYDAFRKGQVTGIALSDQGAAVPGPGATLIADPGARTVWALARAGNGVALATGSQGELARVDPGAKKPEAKQLARLYDTEMFALASDPKGNLYAAGAPVGTVVKISPDGTQKTLFDMPEGVVFALLAAGDGSVYAGTGEQGKLYRIAQDGTATVLAEAGDLALRSLAWGPNGKIWAGTDGRGLLEQFDPATKKFRVVYDADEEEIVSIVPTADGGVYFGANPGAGGGAGGGGGGKGGGDDPPPEHDEIQVIGAGDHGDKGAVGGAGGGGPVGGGPNVYRMNPDGSVHAVWQCPERLIHAVTLDEQGNCLVATGDKAALYRINAEEAVTLLWNPEEEQLLSLLQEKGALYAGTGNPGRLYRIGPEPASEGTITSKTLDAHDQSRWGAVRLDGFAAGRSAETGITVETRSGFTETPDDSWSEWAAAKEGAEGAMVASPPARFLQWRAHIKPDGKGGPALRRVVIAYAGSNERPDIAGIRVSSGEPTFVNQDASRNPPTQVMPNGVQIEYSLPSGGPIVVSAEDVPSWIRGIRSVVWDAQDPDGDNLSYTVQIREVGEASWRTLARDLRDRAWSFESGMIPDGTYEIRLLASDLPSNPAGTELSAERITAPFHVDTKPPVAQDVKARKIDGAVEIAGIAVDESSPIRRIEASVDGDDFRALMPADGVMDSPREAFTGRIPLGKEQDGNWVVVRVQDEAGNRGTFRAWMDTAR